VPWQSDACDITDQILWKDKFGKIHYYFMCSTNECANKMKH